MEVATNLVRPMLGMSNIFFDLFLPESKPIGNNRRGVEFCLRALGKDPKRGIKIRIRFP